jgi:hypothetical protein
MGWGEFALALWIFFLSHAVPVRPPVRSWGRGAARGEGLHLCLFRSVAGRSGLAHPRGGSGALLALAIRPNPFSFGGVRNDRFDPARPGIVGWMRHPLLAALALWAGAHTLANGDLAHVILFGTFAIFALLGGRLIDRRKRRHMGAEWGRLQAAIADGRQPSLPEIVGEAPLRIAAGLALYAALIVLHPLLFGVSPVA